MSLAELSRGDWDPYKRPESKKRIDWRYYASKESLPAQLSTLEDIERVSGTENDLTKHTHGLGDGWMYRVNSVYAVKFASVASIIRVSLNTPFIKENY
jgi:hypothetical protein